MEEEKGKEIQGGKRRRGLIEGKENLGISQKGKGDLDHHSDLWRFFGGSSRSLACFLDSCSV